MPLFEAHSCYIFCPSVLLDFKVPPPFNPQHKGASGVAWTVQKGQSQLAPVSVTSLDIPEEGKEEEKVTCNLVDSIIMQMNMGLYNLFWHCAVSYFLAMIVCVYS